MHRLDREEFLQRRFLALWAMLGFQAGFINSFGFLTCQRYVSHVTGFGTQVGVALGEGDHWFAVEMFAVPFFFIFGSFLSSILTVVQIEKKRMPRYHWVAASLPLYLAFLTLAGQMGSFGTFGEEMLEFSDFALLFSLSFICGIQNGCFTTLTKGQIRTTHLTGISTDIGTDLARIWFGHQDPAERYLMKRANISRITTFAAFSGGAILSTWIDKRIGYCALLIPAGTASIAWWVIHRIRRSSPQAQASKAVTHNANGVFHTSH